MKKWLATILILIVAAGTFIPCCGIDDCCADQPANTSNHDKHNDEGACSPFFSCATCPGSIVVTKTIHIEFALAEKTIHHQTIVKFNLPVYSSSFWQPPRSC